METIQVKGTDLTISRAVLGTMTFGGQVDQKTAESMIDLYLDRGGNFLDTANVYNDGTSELMIGNILRQRRNNVVLATKVGSQNTKVGPGEPRLSQQAITTAIEASLRRLKTDYIDVYYLHQPDYTVPIEESYGAVQSLVEQGKVRHVALSNFAAWQICRILWLAERNGWQAPRIMQPVYNLLARNIEAEYLPMCKELGLCNLVYNPLAGGLLTAKHNRDKALPGSRFDSNKMYRKRYWHGANFDAIPRVQEVAASEGISILQLAFSWLLKHSASDGVILGASSQTQLEQNLDAIDAAKPLSQTTLDGCDALWAQLRGITPQYNR